MRRTTSQGNSEKPVLELKTNASKWKRREKEGERGRGREKNEDGRKQKMKRKRKKEEKVHSEKERIGSRENLFISLRK